MGRREGERAAADESQASNRSIGALLIGIHVAPFIEMGSLEEEQTRAGGRR